MTAELSAVVAEAADASNVKAPVPGVPEELILISPVPVTKILAW